MGMGFILQKTGGKRNGDVQAFSQLKTGGFLADCVSVGALRVFGNLFWLSLGLALLLPLSLRAAGTVVGRLVVTDGKVYLQTKSGKPLVVPDQMVIYEGDIFTTPVKVSGYFL